MAHAGLGRTLRALSSATILAAVVVGCASQESLRAEQAVAQRLKCPGADVESGIQRETAQVREWVVGCNFMYARVHCTDAECHPAPPEPPCIGDLPCFKEDPVTLEWTLADDSLPKKRHP